MNLDEEVGYINQSAPYIVVTGKPGTENSQYFISCERAILLESKTMRDACLDLIATYFVFNISYPKPVSAILLFFQHYMFDIKDKQSIPVNLSKLLTNLKII